MADNMNFDLKSGISTLRVSKREPEWIEVSPGVLKHVTGHSQIHRDPKSNRWQSFRRP